LVLDDTLSVVFVQESEGNQIEDWKSERKSQIIVGCADNYPALNVSQAHTQRIFLSAAKRVGTTLTHANN